MGTITLTIDNRTVNCPSGASILQAARGEGIKIPTLCDHPALQSVGACRLCLVEEKSGRLMAACVTPAAEGMELQTKSERVIAHRKNIVRLLLAEHPESCLVCNKGNQCELRAIAASLGIGQTNLYPMPHPRGLEQANPFLVRDLTKCVLCGKCIRADQELVVVGAIDYNQRGFASRPETAHERPLEASSCTFCGTCVALCPTGALSVKNHHYVGTPERESPSICGFCGVGCSLMLGSAEDRVVEVNPAEDRPSVNGPTLCVRGHFAHDFLNTADRLVSPKVRDGGEFRDTPWEEALSVAARKLREIADKHGPQSIGFMGSSKCTNEENYLFQKMARAVFRTNNVDTGSLPGGYGALRGMDRGLPLFRGPRPLRGLEEAELLFVLGIDPSHSSPVLAYHLKRASRKGVSLIVADPRKTELSHFAACPLQLRPGTDTALLHGMAAIIMAQGGYRSGSRKTPGFPEYREQLASLDLDHIVLTTGVKRSSMEKAADLLLHGKPTFVLGRGILHQAGSRSALEALFNLSLLTGTPDPEVPWLYVPTYENNEAGAGYLGVCPDTLPGWQPVGDEALRRQWERAWEVKLSPDPGLNAIRMIEEAAKGNLKALYIMGENPVRSLPRHDAVRRGLAKLEFLLVQDILETETAQMAHVLLPGAAFSEKGGSSTNMEGRVQFFEPAVEPPGEARPDFEILSQLLKELGRENLGGRIKKIRKEIADMVPAYGEIVSGRAGWVRASAPGIPDAAAPSFFPIAAMDEPAEDENFPFTAILRSFRGHLGAGTRTSRSDRLRQTGWGPSVEISPQDCEELGLRQGDPIRVVSRHGAFEGRVQGEKGMLPKVLSVPRGFEGNAAVELFPLTDKKEFGFSGWITCPVRVEKAEE